jgi:hypothetical protein
LSVKLVRILCVGAFAGLVLSAAPQSERAAAAAPAPAVLGAKTHQALVSHKAIYELTLLRTRPGEGVRAARGNMTYTLADRCDGYTIESNIGMELAFADGNTQKVDQRYASWEAKDGRFSSFTMHTLENGKPAKTYRGTITLKADGSGIASYEADKTTTFDLAPGTLLSTAHTIALLESAAEGKKFFSSAVIDGSFDQGPFVVTAAIARSRNANAMLQKEDPAAVSSGRYFPMSLAYFPASSTAPMPEYELGMQILPSGISRSMTQDFGAFTIGFKLIDLEAVKPEC